MDYKDQILVESTVMQFVNDGSSFTAYDVTKTVRGKSQNSIYHSEVNSEVQKLYAQDDMGSYERDIVDVGAPVDPFVYHYPSVSPSSYNKDWLSGGQSAVAVLDADDDDEDDFGASGLDVASVDEDEDNDDDNTVGVTSQSSSSWTGTTLQTITVKPAKDGRVTVSAKLVSQLIHQDDLRGATLDAYDFDPINHSLEIGMNGGTGTPSNVSYWVDEDNRIRLSKKTLAKAGLDNVQKLELRLVNRGTGINHIAVTAG